MPAKNNELVLKRIYDAPVKAVWDAWADPKQAAQWWGPRGWWIETQSKDLKAGGKWKYMMYGPNGEAFENVTTYHVVEPLARLEYDHGGSEDRPPLFKVRVTFKEVGGKTHMEMAMILDSPEAMKETKKRIKEHSGNSTWDRLAEYLAGEKPKFVINRSFHAPIAKMYDMWTKSEHISKWVAPTGFTMAFIRADVRVGGRSFYKMTNGKDVTMYGSTTYREFTPVTRVVYDQDFRDQDDKISRHPFAPLWPESMTTTVALTDEGDGETRVTLEWTPGAGSSKEEIAEFMKQRAGMTAGWTGSFDKLEEALDSKL